MPHFDYGPSRLSPEPDISPAASQCDEPLTSDIDLVISAPPENALPSYRLNLKPPKPRTGPYVLIRPPKGSLLPPIWIRHPKPVENYIPEFPPPRTNTWRPAERPIRPTRGRRTYFWPPPNGDPLHTDSFLAMPFSKSSTGEGQGSQRGVWFVPVTKELPSIDSVLENGRSRPPQRRHVSWLLEAMGVPIPSDSDSETSDSPGTSPSDSPSKFVAEFVAKQASRGGPHHDGSGDIPPDRSARPSATDGELSADLLSTDGAGFGETRPGLIRSESGTSVSASRPKLLRSESGPSVSANRPGLIRSESGSSISSSKLGKLPQITKIQQRPKSSSNPLPPGVVKPAVPRAAKTTRPSLSGVMKSRKASASVRTSGNGYRTQSTSTGSSSQKAVRPLQLLKATARPFHQLIHSGRKKDWVSPLPSDPPGPEDIEVPYVEKFKVDASILLPSVLKIFEEKPGPSQVKGKGFFGDTSHGAGNNADDIGSATSRSRRRSKSGGRSSDGYGTASEADVSSTSKSRKGDQDDRDGKPDADRYDTPTEFPPALASSSQNRKSKKTKTQVTQFEEKQEDNDYKPRGASVDLEPIPENRPLKLPRTRSQNSQNIEPPTQHIDPNDPLLTWYFPRRSPDYWEMLDDVAKMFEDLQLQEVTLKHFQRPIDYVTVLLCLSNVVFAEMFQTLQEKVTDGTYRIEFVTNGRTGVNLYLSAYSREHTYIAKSLLHKVNIQLDLAKKNSPRSTIQYIHLIECVERVLVHDKRKSWGRVPDGCYSTFTDIDSPAVVHEVGIAESRAELYRRCKRYLAEVGSVNLVVAIKVDSTECEWAELLVLARDPGEGRICKVFNWVRFWGEGAVNGGELKYYPSDFLEVEDRWKIPRAHMRPLDILDGPRCAIVKISFGELGRMVSLAKWENQALMGYIKKPYPWPAGYGGLTHIERVSLEGEQPRKTPDFARTLAIASALNDHHWVEPHVAEDWRAEAQRELDEMAAVEEGEAHGDDATASSSVYSSDDREERAGLEAVEEAEKESESTTSSEGTAPVWPKGVVGLI